MVVVLPLVPVTANSFWAAPSSGWEPYTAAATEPTH